MTGRPVTHTQSSQSPTTPDEERATVSAERRRRRRREQLVGEFGSRSLLSRRKEEFRGWQRIGGGRRECGTACGFGGGEEATWPHVSTKASCEGAVDGHRPGQTQERASDRSIVSYDRQRPGRKRSSDQSLDQASTHANIRGRKQ